MMKLHVRTAVHAKRSYAVHKAPLLYRQYSCMYVDARMVRYVCRYVVTYAWVGVGLVWKRIVRSGPVGGGGDPTLRSMA